MDLKHSLAIGCALQCFSLAVLAQTAENFRSSPTLAGLFWTFVPIVLVGIVLVWFMRSEWKMWAPFQSRDLREVCAHMTDAEKREANRRTALYGLWCGVTFAGPVSVAVVVPTPAVLAVVTILIIIYLGCLRVWLRWQRRFFCSTSWARERGLSPGQLRLFVFRDDRAAYCEGRQKSLPQSANRCAGFRQAPNSSRTFSTGNPTTLLYEPEIPATTRSPCS